MTPGAKAKRLAEALIEIERKTGIELGAGLPLRYTKELGLLFKLEKLARELPEKQEPAPEPQADLDLILEVLENTKGVGPALLKKIKDELDDILPED